MISEDLASEPETRLDHSGLLCGSFITVKRNRERFWHRHQKGAESAPVASLQWGSYILFNYLFSSVQLSLSVVSDSLRPHESQNAGPPCPSPNPGVHPNSCPSSRWWHPVISSSVIPFSSCLQSLPASESIPMSQLFTWGGQSIGVSASALVLPMLISFRMDWLDLLAVQGNLKSLLQHHSSKGICWSPALAARDSTWRGEHCWRWWCSL